MDEAQVASIVRRVIRKELIAALMGQVVSNTDQFRTVMQRFASEGEIPNLRNIQPYGFGSRAPAGTQAVVSPIGHDPSHLNVLGHFDSNRPTMNDGETILYDQFGHAIYLSSSKIQVGSKASANPAVLGDILQEFCDAICNAFLNAPQIGECAVGNVYLDPGVRTAIKNAQTEFVDTASTNFVSQKVFTER